MESTYMAAQLGEYMESTKILLWKNEYMESTYGRAAQLGKYVSTLASLLLASAVVMMLTDWYNCKL